MEEINYNGALSLFIQEIRELKNPSFVNIDNWVLSDDLLDGVLVGYSIKKASDRRLIHDIGLKYGLIPLCPEDVVDLDYSTGKMRSVVVTRFGKYQIQSEANSQSKLH